MGRLIRPGRPWPLGATADGNGVNFALYSEAAAAVEVCLFDETGQESRFLMPARRGNVWHGYVPGIGPGQRYGFRVHGPYDPERGLRFNAAKLLVDPYARAFDGKAKHQEPLTGYETMPRVNPLARDERDSARGVPKCIVVGDDAFDWHGVPRPNVPWRDSVLYEVHVRGFTKRLPCVPEELRGTYLGLASEPAIEHLRSLGVTAVQLLPVHECMDEPRIARRGMTNYWGYSTLGFFAPDQRFASTRGAQITEFKTMVRELHRAGIEVILDVVYNHSAEIGADGPTVSFRGIDNRTYYWLEEEDLRAYVDYTGCGNTLDLRHPETLRLVMESLRYWVTEMQVDGFRFDLATTLARTDKGYSSRASFLACVYQDPVLSKVKLIAEPWDLGPGGYQMGNFPIPFAEWNDRYRDCVRRFLRGERDFVSELGYRLTGSSDLFADDGRTPTASINFVTAHDGFTLRDLVTYTKKRNLENGEGNRDGLDENFADNCGVEGETTDPAILELRARQQRNFFTLLFLSLGVPMICAGDELGRTQRGNNNAYCLDNEVVWLDWDLCETRKKLLAFVRDLAKFRAHNPVFRRVEFFSGQRTHHTRLKDIAWFGPNGTEMETSDWTHPRTAYLAFLVAGDSLAEEDGSACDSYLVLLSGESEPLRAKLPDATWGSGWVLVLDTARESFAEDGSFVDGDTLELAPRSVVVLRRTWPQSGSWRPPHPKSAC